MAIGSPPFQPPTRCSRPSTLPKRSVSAEAHSRVASSERRSTRAAVEAVLGKAEVGAELVEPLLVDVGGGDRRAVVGQAASDGRSEAAGGAGDGDHASVELSHREAA